MNIPFTKYQGTGNDFIMIDDRLGEYSKLPLFSSSEKIALLCHRRFGIGADGLILLQSSEDFDFKMKYYNSDGNESTMCGNGGRCIVHFAYSLEEIGNTCTFIAIDGEHPASIEGDIVSLKMQDIKTILSTEQYSVLDTGSPHYVSILSEGLDDLDVDKAGAEVRYSPDFEKEGINVNFVENKEPHHIQVRTYERGVEAETYSCGTGVTAASIVSAPVSETSQVVRVDTLGGELQVRLTKTSKNSAQDIWLIGPATPVFNGTIEL